jgi:TPR repeat protein
LYFFVLPPPCFLPLCLSCFVLLLILFLRFALPVVHILLHMQFIYIYLSLATQLSTRGAEAGDSLSIRNLGLCYERGGEFDSVIEKDMARALQLYQRAVDLGSTHAMVSLGRCYYNNPGGDVQQAIRLMQQAVDLGSSFARIELAAILEAEDQVEYAYQLLLQAKESGDLNAIDPLFRCYKHGIGVEADQARAVKLLEERVEVLPGETWALVELARCHLKGLGVPENAIKAVTSLISIITLIIPITPGPVDGACD